ncbi:putative ribonuclease P complex subunit Pop4 [Aspergillus heteromorphus CBS 117.55]|uniref:Ribonuclease P protein subunit n=1 Tax=Aspergillus heteromorphus CBS 117.55 TaxID=1448321 RepID=A0A317WHV6_9EURO|nr:putative ribonuclease P complex subunit Pop4 [Aspergillus heteromorphus CBS 117.55]PWY84852.1 putative ribonuclease P complex subunit Pop4 [Aspergillus heteromorphus CBS 117.55]
MPPKPSTTTTPSQPHIAQTLLTRAHSPTTATTLFTERVVQKPLYIRPTSPTPSDNRSRRRLHRLRKHQYFLRKQKPQPLSAREKRVSGLHALPPAETKYEVFQELNRLWVAYMQGVLDLGGRRGGGGPLVTATAQGSKLVSADFHGAEVEVVRSRCAGRVGVRGIVVRDTKFAFVLVKRGGGVVTIPKEQTIFRFYVPVPLPVPETETETKEQKGKGKDEAAPATETDNAPKRPQQLVFELHGSQFQNRPVDRANKKFKWRNVDYI